MVFKIDNKRRLVALAALLALALVAPSSAAAWAWPVSGPVLRPFHVEDDPYGGGQHRGIDIGAAAGEDVLAPVAGVVAFSGTVPGGGRTITLRTEDGYSVTLLRLGPLAVRAGTRVEEGDVLATVGPSRDGEPKGPYIYLGVRLTAEEHGYVDPLSLLPPRPSRSPEPAPAPAQPPTPAPSPAPRPAEQSVQPPARAPAPVKLRTAAPRSPQAPRARTRVAEPVRRRQAVRGEPELEPSRAIRLPTAAPVQSSVERAVPVRAGRTAPRQPVRPPLEAPVGDVDRASSGFARAHTRRGHALGRHGAGARWWLVGLAAAGLALCALAAKPRRRPGSRRARRGLDENALRKMSAIPPAPEESLAEPHSTIDPCRSRLAVRERAAAHRPRRRLRRPFGHVRALPPAAGQSRPHGQRHGRARHARDGHGRSRRSLVS